MFFYHLGLGSEFFPSQNPSTEVAEPRIGLTSSGQTPGAVLPPTMVTQDNTYLMKHWRKK